MPGVDPTDGHAVPETRVVGPLPHDGIATRPLEQAGAASPEVSSPPARIAAGTILGRYFILRELGHGAMGAVYAAYDPQLDRKVALKRLLSASRPSPRTEAGSDEAARLHREARSLAKLSHPNVVQIYEVGEHDGVPHIVMELVDGTSLRAWSRQRERAWPEVLAVLLEAGRGLAAAHEAGLLHRDFKPDNVLVGADGRVRVADFGLAKRPTEWTEAIDPEVASIALVESGPMSSLSDPLTEHGALVGTLPYMAPEQHYVRVPVDARVDQYAFCVTAWELLCGERPFRGRSRELLAKKRRGPPPWPSDSKLPKAVIEALRRGLAVVPSERWPSMLALLDAMRPPPARRWWAWASAVALTGGGVLAGIALQRPQAVCTGAHGQIEQAWSAEAEAAVEAAVLGTGLAYAPTTWGAVQARLDAYAERWSAMHTEACEATAVRGEQSQEVLDLRMACLEQRREALRATVELLREADAAAVEQAIDLVDGLPALERCADVSALRARVAPPDDPAVAEEIERLRTHLVQAEVQRRAGRYEEALATLAVLDERAHALGYGPFTAQVAYELGTTLSGVGRGRPAMGQLETAYVAALEHGDDELAARAAAGMAAAMIDAVTEPEQGITWATSALALARRGHRGAPLEAETLSVAGSVLAAAGDAVRAVAWHRQAVELLERRPEASEPQLATALSGLGSALHERGRLDESLRALERAQAIVERIYGPAHPRAITQDTNVGTALLEVGRSTEGIAMLEHALVRAEATWPSGHPQLVYIHNTLGVAHSRGGNTDAALAALRRSQAVSEQVYGPGHLQTTNAMINIAGVLQAQGEIEEAIALIRRAIALCEASLGPRHPQLAEYHGALGYVLDAADRHDDARAAYEHALEIQRDALEPSNPVLATTLAALGRVRRSLGHHAEAEVLLRQALEIVEAAFDDAHPRVRSVRWSLAHVLADQGRTEDARMEMWRVAAPSSDPSAAELAGDAKAWLGEPPGPPAPAGG